MAHKVSLKVAAPDAGRRVDRFLQSQLPLPYTQLRRLLRRGDVKCNGKKIGGDAELAVGDELTVFLTEPLASRPADPATVGFVGPDPHILRRDANYLVVDKPAGISCSDDDPQSSLQSWLAETLRAEIEAGAVRPEVCHRLDRGTTGVVVVALSAGAVTHFHRALAEGRVKKDYRVMVWGSTPAKFECTERLVRHAYVAPGHPKVIRAKGRDGVKAHTRFRRIAVCTTPVNERVSKKAPKSKVVTLLAAEPVTGRTHQIRAHLKSAGWSVVGDPRYGDPTIDRAHAVAVDHQLLHAREIAFDTETGHLTAVAPFPRDFEDELNRLGLVESSGRD